LIFFAKDTKELNFYKFQYFNIYKNPRIKSKQGERMLNANDIKKKLGIQKGTKKLKSKSDDELRLERLNATCDALKEIKKDCNAILKQPLNQSLKNISQIKTIKKLTDNNPLKTKHDKTKHEQLIDAIISIINGSEPLTEDNQIREDARLIAKDIQKHFNI
jgi:hypothetical protein